MPSIAVERALRLPPADVGMALIGLREDQWFERKGSRIAPRDLADCMVGMANAEGGVIVVGLAQGRVEGVRTATHLNAWRQAAIDFTEPLVPVTSRLLACRTSEGIDDELLVLEIRSSDRVHANRRDDVYLRIGDENRRLTFAQRQELLYDKGQAGFEVARSGASLDDLDRDLLREYADAVGHPDPYRLLAARGLLTADGEVTVAALLLFGKHPQVLFPEASIRVLRYRGTERGTGSRQHLLEDVRVDGPIPRQLHDVRRVVFELMPTRRALGADGRFGWIGVIPEDAWLEGVVNAAIHRSYSLLGDHVRVSIFEDRIEIESPGRFPGIVDLGNLVNVTRFARNPRVARVCADLDFGQELGEGVRRIFEEMRLAGLAEPEYAQTSGSVRLTLRSTPVDRALEDRLPAGSREVLRLIREAGRLGTGDIVSMVGLSRPVVIRRLRELERFGLVEWVGNSRKDPRAYWKLRVE